MQLVQSLVSYVSVKPSLLFFVYLLVSYPYLEFAIDDLLIAGYLMLFYRPRFVTVAGENINSSIVG